MLPQRRPAPGPPFYTSPPTLPEAADASEEEGAALAVSDQRTLYLANIFIGNTARFLNSFASICQDKLLDVHRRILKLDANLALLEGQLRGSCKVECQGKDVSETAGSTSKSAAQAQTIMQPAVNSTT